MRCTEILLDCGAEVDIRTALGVGWATPLMDAARGGHRQTTILLLRYGASATVDDASGRTAWDLALALPRTRQRRRKVALAEVIQAHIFRRAESQGKVRVERRPC